MQIFECTVYEKINGDSRPFIIDGHMFTREIVAETRSKARYRYWIDLRESWEEIRLIDIRVRSFRGPVARMEHGWQDRLNRANSIIEVMATHGRRFFSEDADRHNRMENPFISTFSVDRKGDVWFTDSYTRKLVLVRHQDWPGFTNGGTCRAIVEHLAAHIQHGAPINVDFFSASPKWVCDGDLWGYGPDMLVVAEKVKELASAQQ